MILEIMKLFILISQLILLVSSAIIYFQAKEVGLTFSETMTFFLVVSVSNLILLDKK